MLDPVRARIRDDVLSSYEDPAADLTRRVLARLPAHPAQRRSPIPALAITAALVLIAAAVLGARAAHLFSFSTVANPSDGLRPPSASYSIVDNQFVSATTGWILIQMHTTSGPLVLLKTSDGGDHWVEQFRYGGRGSIDDIQFAPNGRDGSMEWSEGGATLVSPGQPLPPSQTTVRKTYVTHDGGNHWILASVTSQPNPPKGAPQPTYYPGQTVYLPNGKEGWQLPTPSDRTADTPVMHTTDAGATWTRIGTLPAAIAEGQLSFSDSRTGFLTFSANRSFAWDGEGRPLPAVVPPALLYVTHDGGVTWRTPVLSLPAAASSRNMVTGLGQPVMLDASHGLLPLQLTSAPTAPNGFTSPNAGAPPASFVLKTADGGDHWGILTSVSGTPSDGNLLFMSFDHWLIGKGGFLSETTDGGKTWSKPRRVLADGLELSLASWDYTPPSVIWAQVGAGSLIRSIDGGQHWTAVTPPQVK
jgi:photosystem II stability/assembly factor-like uncharacterized protein